MLDCPTIPRLLHQMVSPQTSTPCWEEASGSQYQETFICSIKLRYAESCLGEFEDVLILKHKNCPHHVM